MRDDDGEDGPKDLSDSEIEIVEGGGIAFGDYSVLSPGVQIILAGRTISHPGE
ncbi:MAG: hypothetical protein AB8B85_09270 [Paracoccaceae bacterium]